MPLVSSHSVNWSKLILPSATLPSFQLHMRIPILQFLAEGSADHKLRSQDASNMVHSMFRQAWNNYCRDRGLLAYGYSAAIGFHVSKDQAKIGQRIPWGNQGERRWSMLRNVAKGYVWQFGVTAQPAFWPYFHFKLKSRVLFAPLNVKEAGDPFEDDLPWKFHPVAFRASGSFMPVWAG